MNKLNFDGLKSIKAPSEWIEKAAAIPEAPVKKRAAFPIYRIAAAASIVLVSMIGLIVFFFNRNSVPVASPEPAATETNVYETVNTSETVKPTQYDGILPAEQRNTDSPESTKPGNTGSPTTETEPSGAPVQPTQAVAPTEAAYPTAPPQTEPPKSTDPPAPTNPPAPTDPPAPTNPPETQKPTDYYEDMVENDMICFTAIIPASMIEDGEIVYCSYTMPMLLENETENEFTAQYNVMDNGFVYVHCEIENEYKDIGHSVTYNYYFYTANNKRLASGRIVV